MCDVISDAAARRLARLLRMETSMQWFLLLGSSITDDVALDTNKGSIARAQEGINSKGNIIDIYYPISNTTVPCLT